LQKRPTYTAKETYIRGKRDLHRSDVNLRGAETERRARQITTNNTKNERKGLGFRQIKKNKKIKKYRKNTRNERKGLEFRV